MSKLHSSWTQPGEFSCLSSSQRRCCTATGPVLSPMYRAHQRPQRRPQNRIKANPEREVRAWSLEVFTVRIFDHRHAYEHSTSKAENTFPDKLGEAEKLERGSTVLTEWSKWQLASEEAQEQ